MLKLVGIVAAVVVVLLVALLGYALTKPDRFRVERTTSINAPPEQIFPFIVDFHRWSAWSPWEKLDPTMQRAFSGAPQGTGAVYAWDGNGKVGSGRMEIIGATAPSAITIKLDFLKPFEAHNLAEFTLRGNGGSTNLTWAMHGSNSYLAKLMSVFVSMDSLVGKDFEAGLANLKAAAEQP
jgi:uncharacterized protein YndB with AHSA1/START domain